MVKKINECKTLRDWRDLSPMKGEAKVISVYDGDTCWLKIDTNNPEASQDLPLPNRNFVKVNVRLAIIDTPEIKGGTEESREKARNARDFLRQLILDKYVDFEFGNFGTKGESMCPYHRQIGIIKLKDGTNVNSLMLESGHAKKYC